MSNLLEIEGAVKAFPKPEITQVKEFKKLIKEADKPERLLAYIYHMESNDSSYMKYSTQQKEIEVKNDLFGDEDWEEPDFVSTAREKYVELNKSPEQELLESAINTVYKYIDYFEAIDPTEVDENGKLKWKMKDVTRVMEKLPGVVDSLENLRERVEKKEESQGDVRGDVKINKYNK